MPILAGTLNWKLIVPFCLHVRKKITESCGERRLDDVATVAEITLILEAMAQRAGGT